MPNPATEEIVAAVPRPEIADAERALVAARTAFDEGPWPKMKTGERAKKIRRFAELLVNHAPTLERIESLDVGKPVKESGGHDRTQPPGQDEQPLEHPHREKQSAMAIRVGVPQ